MWKGEGNRPAIALTDYKSVEGILKVMRRELYGGDRIHILPRESSGCRTALKDHDIHRESVLCLLDKGLWMSAPKHEVIFCCTRTRLVEQKSTMIQLSKTKSDSRARLRTRHVPESHCFPREAISKRDAASPMGVFHRGLSAQRSCRTTMRLETGKVVSREMSLVFTSY